jgi:hypothetical protein
MSKDKGFALIPMAVPARQRGSSIYKQIVGEFLESGEKSVAIRDTGRKPVTLVQGLRKFVEAEGTKGVKVVQRSQDVFLTRD